MKWIKYLLITLLYISIASAAGIKDYSTSASSNNATPPNGFPEGMAPSQVNNSARQVMADIREFAEDGGFFDWGHTVSNQSTTEFRVDNSHGNQETIYTVGRRVELTDSSTLQGTITAVAYTGGVGTDVTVSLDSGSISASLSAVKVGPDIEALNLVELHSTVKGPFISNNVIAAHKNLSITRTSATVIRVQADELLLEDSSGNIFKATSVDENITITTSGISGLDSTDTEGADTWYYLFILYNGTAINGFMSDSASPTLPAGYTYSAYVGADYNDSSSDLLDIKQTNKRVSYYSRVSDFSGAGSTGGALVTITAPPNSIAVLHNLTSRNNDAKSVLITETFQEDVAASQGVSTTYVSADSEQAQNEVQRRLDSSSQVRVRTDTTGGSTSIVTLGWIFE